MKSISELIITNNEGKTMARIPLKLGENIQQINTAQYTPGAYFCNLYVEGVFNMSKKFIVIHN